MARKNAASLEEARAEIRRNYRRGSKTGRAIRSIESLSDVETAVLKTKACFLKAAGFSHSYIADALDLKKSTVGHWFEEPEMRAEVLTINDDMIGGALKLLKTYSVEMIEILIEIARTSDDKTALDAVKDALDRMGLTKVNKSEGKLLHESTQTLEITDKAGLIEKLRSAPPEVQQQAAEHMEAMMALTAEFTDSDVTHA